LPSASARIGACSALYDRNRSNAGEPRRPVAHEANFPVMRCIRVEIESMWGRKASMTPAIPLKTFPNATPSPMIAGFTLPCRSLRNRDQNGVFTSAEALSCRMPIASAADRTNGVIPGRAFFMATRARVKMGITAGCRLLDQAENAVLRSR
jgi:hypothetical protein